MQSGIHALTSFFGRYWVDNFGCTWTLCSTQSENGWPQRSQLQPGVPSLGRCVTLLPATFCNLGLGDPLSSCNKRIVFISYSIFAWQAYGRRDRKTSAVWLLPLQNLLRKKPTATIWNSSSTPSVRTCSFLYLIVDYRGPPDDRQVT